jgi:class 3 adenylate cyclase
MATARIGANFRDATVTIGHVTDAGADRSTIDELLDRAVLAINRGDRATAEALAGRVLAVDHSNVDAEELLAAPADHGEIRRITIMFADLVDSTALSTRIEPETYRTVVGRYREEVLGIVNHYEGHVGNTKGDGLLAVFGHPHAHENDALRAVQAGLDITRDVARLSDRVRRRFGFDINVRVGIHRGVVYLDTAQDDVYGFAANLAARMCSIAEPGTVAVSEAVERLVRDTFELQAGPPQKVKGVDASVVPYRAIAEHETTPVSRGPLVGRLRELGYLEASWEQALARDLTVAGVAFCGEPGIGKSRLARAAVGLAERSDAVVLKLFGSPFHSDVGLHPIRKLLERRCHITRTSTPEDRLRLLRTELQARSLDADTAVALLAPVLGISPDTGYDPVAAEGHKLHENISTAIQEYLIACTGGQPALVLVEDMHWFDASTIEVVQALLGAGLERMLVVMTARELASLPDSSKAQVFALTPLTDDETDQLISALHPEMSAPNRNVVRRRCDGVPLYIEEVVAKLKEHSSDGEDSARVPDTLYEALFARLRSSEGAIRVVEAAATIGSQFDHGLLRSVMAMSERDLDRVLEELRNTTVLEPVGENAWRFRHELLREVAAELAPPSIQRSLHSRVAEALKSADSQEDPDWPLIAGHFERAHRFDEAVSAYQQASAAARHRGALGEARTNLSRALSQLEHLPAGLERDRREMNLRLRHGFLASAAEGPGSVDTASDFERCLQLGETDPHADELFATLMALFTYYVGRGDLHRGQQIVESLRVGVDDGREWWRTENIGGSGTLAWFRGDFAYASIQLEKAATLMASRGHRDVEAEWFMPHDPVVLGLTGLAHARWVLGDLAGADEALTRSARRTDGLGFPQGPFSICYALFNEVWICLEAGRVPRAAELAAEMLQRGERHGFDQWIAMGATLHSDAAAMAALGAGHLDAPAVSDGIAALTGWTAACRYIGAKGFVTCFDGHLARLLTSTGRPAEACEQANAGLQLAEETGMHYYDAELLRLRAATHADPEARHADLQAAFELARKQGAPVFMLRAALDDYQLRGDTDRRAVAEAVGRFPADSTWPDVARARALLG